MTSWAKIRKMLWIIVFLLLVVFAIGKCIKKVFPYKYLEYIENCENNIDPLFILSIIKVESNFKEDAHSNRGAKGLMQIMDHTALWGSQKMKLYDFSPNMLYNASDNIRIGVWYLNWLKDRYESDELVLVAYNAGVGNLNKWLKDSLTSDNGKDLKYIPFEETSNYLLKVKFTYMMYKIIYRDLAWITDFF